MATSEVQSKYEPIMNIKPPETPLELTPDEKESLEKIKTAFENEIFNSDDARRRLGIEEFDGTNFLVTLVKKGYLDDLGIDEKAANGPMQYKVRKIIPSNESHS